MIERDERMKQLITQQDIIDEYRQSEFQSSIAI